VADPNWLYSSTAQSAAAIVAIVGGFITSRLLGLSAERSALQNELAAKQSKLKALQNQDHDLGEESQRLDAWNGLWRMEVTGYGDPIPELQQLRAENAVLQELDPAIVQEVYEESRSRLEAAFSFVRDNAGLIEAADTNLSEWLSKHRLSIEGLDRHLVSSAFKDVAEARRTQAKEEARKRSPFGIQMPDFSFALPTLSTLPDTSIVKQDPKERIREEKRNLAAQIEILQSDVAHLGERLSAFRYPPNMWWGLVILAYLTVGGVIVPLALLPVDVHREELKWTVLALFSSGILALFVYIGTQILDLQKGSRGS